MLVPYLGEAGAVMVACIAVAVMLAWVRWFVLWCNRPYRDLADEIKKRPPVVVALGVCHECELQARLLGWDAVWLYPDGHILGLGPRSVQGAFAPAPRTFCGRPVKGFSRWYCLPVLSESA